MVRRPPGYAAQRARFTDDLLAIMSMEEKVGQMVLLPAPASGAEGEEDTIRERLRAGRLGGLIGACSPPQLASLQRFAIEEGRLGIPLLVADAPGRGQAMVMPSPFALAATWAPGIIQRALRLVATEARDQGKNWLLGPEVVLSTAIDDPGLATTWGTSSVLAHRLASAMIRGLQGEDQEGLGVMACLRVDDLSGERRRNTEKFAETLRLVAGVLRETLPGSVALGTASRPALGDSNPDEAPAFPIGRPGGYDRIDLTEWSAIAHATGQDSFAPPFFDLTFEVLSEAVEDGRVPPPQLDDAVRKIIAAKYDLGLFHTEGPDLPRVHTETIEGARTVALEAARHSIVLLRNEPALLPLTLDSGAILVIGNAAGDRKLPVGGTDAEATSLLEGLDALGVAHNHVPGLALRRSQEDAPIDKLVEADRMAIGMASEAARRAGTVIVCLGEIGSRCEAQRTLLDAVHAANPNIVLVTLGQRPFDPVVRGGKLPSVIHAGGLGSMSGHAIADVLTGEFAPRGRLPMALVDTSGIGLSLGHGLGYSDFGLGDTAIELRHDRVTVSAMLHNVGNRNGTETVQVYLRRPRGRGQTANGLVDFQRISLEAGESRQLLFELGAGELGRFEPDGQFVVEAGTYEVSVGLSEARAHSVRLTIPQALTEGMERGLASGPLPALFGKISRAS